MKIVVAQKVLVIGVIVLFIGIAVVPATTSYSKTRETDVDHITLVSKDPQFDNSSTGGLIVGPFLFAKISANFSTECGWVRRSGRSIVFEFGPYEVGYLNLRPLSQWNDPLIIYSNTTGEPISHKFWVGATWFFGKVKYSNDRILIDGWCIRMMMFIDFYYMIPDVTLIPVDDTYVDAYYPDQNFGAAEVLEVTDNNGIETARTYLKFNVFSIPSNVKIHYALLQFYYCDSEGGGEPEVGVYQVNTSWDEDTITWVKQPEFSPIYEHYNLLSQYDPLLTEYWDLTELVRGWKSGSIPNNGVVVKFCNPCQSDITQRVFRSKEWDIENEKPRLIITYY